MHLSDTGADKLFLQALQGRAKRTSGFCKFCVGGRDLIFPYPVRAGSRIFFVKVFAREGRGSGKIFSAAKRVQTDVAPRGRVRAEILYPAAGQRKRGMPYHAVGQARAGMPYLAREKHKSSFFFNPKGSVLEKHAKQAEKRQKTTPARRLTGDFCSRRYSIV